MKKLLLLIPLLLVGCSRQNVYINVKYHYDNDENLFVVELDKKHSYKVPSENYHEVRVNELEYYNGFYVHNRFYLKEKLIYNYFTECCAIG